MVEGMDPNDEAAALAHQMELEQRRYDEEQRLLANDPGYLKWLDELNEQRIYDEIPR